MNTSCKIIAHIFISVIVLKVQSQDINFSQFYELPMLRNPALAGIFKGDIRVTAAYRNQWQNITVPYRTMALGAEIRFAMGENSDDYWTVDLQITNDVAGDSKLSRIQVFPGFNYHKSLNNEKDNYIAAGAMAGPVQQSFDPAKLHFDDQFVNGSYNILNPTQQTFDKTNFTYWDIAAGVSYNGVLGYDTRYYFGLGLFHFIEPKVSFFKQNNIRLNPKLGLNFGLSLVTSDNEKIILYADYYKQAGHTLFQRDNSIFLGGNTLFQGGLLYSYNFLQDEDYPKGITGGLFYRWADALIPVAKLELYPLSIGFSYDFNVSKLKTASQHKGGLEVTLSYKSYLNIRNSSLQKLRCTNL